MPQTKFVLKHALAKGLKPIVVINKIDRENSRIAEVVHLTQDLFLELATDAEQLVFPVLYTSARDGTATADPEKEGEDLLPLFESILQTVPPPGIESGPFQMLVSNLDYSSYKGKLAIGKIYRGSVKPHDKVAVIGSEGSPQNSEENQVVTFLGLDQR